MAQLERKGHTPETTTGATLKRTLREFSEDHGTDWAAALTYYGVLALFPALIAMSRSSDWSPIRRRSPRR